MGSELLSPRRLADNWIWKAFTDYKISCVIFSSMLSFLSEENMHVLEYFSNVDRLFLIRLKDLFPLVYIKFKGIIFLYFTYKKDILSEKIIHFYMLYTGQQNWRLQVNSSFCLNLSFLLSYVCSWSLILCRVFFFPLYLLPSALVLPINTR